MKISQIIKSTKDEEFRDLLVEVTEKDWAAELEDFEDKVINIKVDDLSKDINTNQEEGLRGSYIGGLLFATIGLFISKDLILLASLIAMIGVCMVLVILMERGCRCCRSPRYSWYDCIFNVANAVNSKW